MRVAVVSSELVADEGGSWTFTRGLLEELGNRSHSHEFLVWPHNQQREQSIFGRGFRKIRRALGHDSQDVSTENGRLLERRAIDEHIDLVWFLNAAEPMREVPYIATIWDLQHRLQPWFPEVSWAGWTRDARERYYSGVLRGASRVFVGTSQGRSEVQAAYGLPQQIIDVLPFFAPRETENDLAASTSTPKELTPLGNRPFFFYPAQYWPHKNHVGLLHAFARFKQTDSRSCVLLLVGSDKGNLPHIRRLISALDLDDFVLTLGFVSRSTIIYCYKSAIGLCFPTYFGPDNIPPLEAFSLGCPVLASRVPGSEEQLGDAAVLIPPSDSEAWATAMRRLADDSALRQELIARGLEKAMSLSAANYVAQAIAVIDEFSLVRRAWGADFQKRI